MQSDRLKYNMLIKRWWRDWPNETAATIWKPQKRCQFLRCYSQDGRV